MCHFSAHLKTFYVTKMLHETDKETKSRPQMKVVKKNKKIKSLEIGSPSRHPGVFGVPWGPLLPHPKMRKGHFRPFRGRFFFAILLYCKKFSLFPGLFLPLALHQWANIARHWQKKRGLFSLLGGLSVILLALNNDF